MDIVQNDKVCLDSESKAYQIFSDFMTRIAKFEELVSVGSEFLAGFHRNLDFLCKTSEVVNCASKASPVKSARTDAKIAQVNFSDGARSVSKLNSCQEGLEEHLHKAKDMLNELEGLIDVVLEVMHSSMANKPKFTINCSGDGLTVHQTDLEKEEDMEHNHSRKSKMLEYAALMGSIYSMVKKDYAMQEKIILSLDLNTSVEELQSYCDMWSIRPYIDDETMSQAWKLIPGL